MIADIVGRVVISQQDDIRIKGIDLPGDPGEGCRDISAAVFSLGIHPHFFNLCPGALYKIITGKDLALLPAIQIVKFVQGGNNTFVSIL